MEKKRHSRQITGTFIILAISIFFFAIVSLQPAYADDYVIDSGDNWRITSDYELIVGQDKTSMDLPLYSESTPWSKHENKIKRISFQGTIFAYADARDFRDSIFKRCKNMTSIDLSGFDTSKVTGMYSLFSGCRNLTSIDLSGFDTSKVMDMDEMFSGCSNLTSIDLSGFDTSNVINMSFMFNGCRNLTSIDLSGFDTSNVRAMVGMFNGCSSLTDINLSGLNTGNVESMPSMFDGCSSLTSIDLSGFDTGNATSMDYMFGGCSSLTSIDLSGFDTGNVEDMHNMFNGCRSLTSIDLSGFDTGGVSNMSGMFFYCDSLTDICLGAKSIFSADSSFPSENWTRYKLIDGTAVAGPPFSTITEYIGTDPGWYKISHKWNTKYTVDKKATYAAKGSKSIHCSVCNAIKEGSSVSIPKLTVKATTLSSVIAAKKAFTVKWKKGSKITGYQIQYALNSKFTKGAKKVTITKSGTVSKKITKLKAKKKYYVRVRTYKKVSGKTYYSKWSKYKYVTTK